MESIPVAESLQALNSIHQTQTLIALCTEHEQCFQVIQSLIQPVGYPVAASMDAAVPPHVMVVNMGLQDPEAFVELFEHVPKANLWPISW